MNNFLTKFKSRVPFVRAEKSAAARGSGAQTLTLASSFGVASLFVRFSIKDQTLFAKRLSFLIKAGVPVSESVHMLREQTRSSGKRRVFELLAKDVTGGQYLSTSLGKHRRLFGDFAVNLIRVGEQGGVLSQNLAYLADELQKKHELRRKVLGALIYPVFISIATLGVTALLTVYIFPKLMPIFTSLHVQLPLSTRALLAVANYLRAWGLLTLFSIAVIVIATALVRSRVESVRYFFDRILLSVPLAGALARRYNLTNFCRTLGLLLKSGIRLTDAIAITGATMNNLAFRRASERMAQKFLRGESMSRALESERTLFPDMLRHLVAVGEKTGNLSTTLTYLSQMYESEVEDLTKSLGSSIEPALMIVMGLLVGLIAVSVITPIYAITQHLNPK